MVYNTRDRVPEININQFNEHQEIVIRKLAKKINSEVEIIYVDPLGRYGKSTAKVFLANLHITKKGMPWVFKIDDKDSFTKEKKGLQIWSDFIETARTAREAQHGDWGAIAYSFVGDFSGPKINITEFKDLIIDKETDTSFLKCLLSDVYQNKCSLAHKSGDMIGIYFKENYSRYLRNDETKAKLIATFSNDSEKVRIKFLRAWILNPIFLLERGFKERIECLTGVVHGDLHSSNILITPNEDPALIDFAWGDEGAHVLKDFVLMESSIRFLLFPQYVNMDEQLKVDKILLEEEGFDDVVACIDGSPLRFEYQRMAEMVGVVRQQAKRLWKDIGADFDFDEYLAAQFLVLYGLLKYEDYNFYAGVRALGLIASKLKDTKFGF